MTAKKAASAKPDAPERPKRRSLSVTDAAAQLGVSKDTLYRLIDRKNSSIDLGWTSIRIVQVGQRVVIPQAEIDRALCEEAS